MWAIFLRAPVVLPSDERAAAQHRSPYSESPVLPGVPVIPECAVEINAPERCRIPVVAGLGHLLTAYPIIFQLQTMAIAGFIADRQRTGLPVELTRLGCRIQTIPTVDRQIPDVHRVGICHCIQSYRA